MSTGKVRFVNLVNGPTASVFAWITDGHGLDVNELLAKDGETKGEVIAPEDLAEVLHDELLSVLPELPADPDPGAGTAAALVDCLLVHAIGKVDFGVLAEALLLYHQGAHVEPGRPAT